MILTMTRYHENLFRDSPLYFLSSLKTIMILKIPNETILRITRYDNRQQRGKSVEKSREYARDGARLALLVAWYWIEKYQMSERTRERTNERMSLPLRQASHVRRLFCFGREFRALAFSLFCPVCPAIFMHFLVSLHCVQRTVGKEQRANELLPSFFAVTGMPYTFLCPLAFSRALFWKWEGLAF